MDGITLVNGKSADVLLLFFLIPDHHVQCGVWVCSPLIPLNEESPAGRHYEGHKGDDDADLLDEASYVASAEGPVDLKKKLWPGLLNINRK